MCSVHIGYDVASMSNRIARFRLNIVFFLQLWAIFGNFSRPRRGDHVVYKNPNSITNWRKVMSENSEISTVCVFLNFTRTSISCICWTRRWFSSWLGWYTIRHCVKASRGPSSLVAQDIHSNATWTQLHVLTFALTPTSQRTLFVP